MKRCAIYARVSTVDQCVNNQLYDLRQFAAQRGLEVVCEFTDVGISGRKCRRPGLDAMLRDARKRKFSVLIVAAFDRLARSTRHFLSVVDELDSLGIEFISKRENIATDGAMGRLFITLISAIAELEADLIKERVRAGIRRRRLEGLPVGRQPLAVDQRVPRGRPTEWYVVDRSCKTVLRFKSQCRAMGQGGSASEPGVGCSESILSPSRGGGRGMIIVRFKRPSGTGQKLPSEALNRAMVSLAESAEMQPLLCEASSEGKALAIDIFQNRDGQPLLIHFKKEKA